MAEVQPLCDACHENPSDRSFTASSSYHSVINTVTGKPLGTGDPICGSCRQAASKKRSRPSCTYCDKKKTVTYSKDLCQHVCDSCRRRPPAKKSDLAPMTEEIPPAACPDAVDSKAEIAPPYESFELFENSDEFIENDDEETLIDVDDVLVPATPSPTPALDQVLVPATPSPSENPCVAPHPRISSIRDIPPPKLVKLPHQMFYDLLPHQQRALDYVINFGTLNIWKSPPDLGSAVSPCISLSIPPRTAFVSYIETSGHYQYNMKTIFTDTRYRPMFYRVFFLHLEGGISTNDKSHARDKKTVSHLCHNTHCYNWNHMVFEDIIINQARSYCNPSFYCNHKPRCHQQGNRIHKL